MYPFYVNDEKIFSFSYMPRKGGVVKDDDTGKWYEITGVDEGRGRKITGKSTFNMDNADWRPMI
ncbi:hypothetical protein ACI2JA_15575 [Alkalihalobacillus sp. NPDC078783]